MTIFGAMADAGPMHPGILVVEDDHDIRESIVEALEEEGFPVTSAVDGVDALEQLRDADPLPGIILLDLMMPRMSGVQFRDEIRGVPEWSSIPILVVTAHAGGTAKAGSLGAAGVLLKPFQLEQLSSVVNDILHKTGRAAHA
jgi:CheY-like chemotaxis protein